MATTACVLPGGYLDRRGACARDAVIGELRGRDEDLLNRLPANMSETRGVTEILSRVVRRIGPHRMTRNIANALPPGDRDYLMLKTWQLSFGNRVQMVLRCPAPSCAAQMDVDFDVGEVSVETRPRQPSHTARIAGADVVFRIPLASDVEAVGGGGATDPVAALVARCVESIDGKTRVTEQDVIALPVDVRSALEAEIERACPRLALDFEAVCPECGVRFDHVHDPAATLLAALHRTRDLLQQHVHLLSIHYHWPLREILDMPRGRRLQYVQLLLGQLAATGAATVSRP